MVDPRVRALYYLYLINEQAISTIFTPLTDKESWWIMFDTALDTGYRNKENVARAIFVELANDKS